MTSINIGGKERPVRMRMLAVRHFRKLTGLNLLGGKLSMTDIIGGGDKEFDADLFIYFLYCVLLDGCHPDKPDFNEDDVAAWVSPTDTKLIADIFKLWFEAMTGKSQDEFVKDIEKNPIAPESGQSNGQPLRDSPMVN